jgi:hypothetical protein
VTDAPVFGGAAAITSEYTLGLLLAREEIRDVLLRRARGTDRLDMDMILSCHHRDSTEPHFGSVEIGVEDFEKIGLPFVSAFASTQHFLGSASIAINGDVAQVETPAVVHHLSQPDDAGRQSDWILGMRYLDRFERRDGRWLIARRLCACDWTYSVNAELPIAGSTVATGDDFRRGSRDRSDLVYLGA